MESAEPASLPFEKALERLESIVDAMEQGDVALGELLEQYEEGDKMLKICEQRLKEAELRIDQLKSRSGQPPELTPFEADES